jgi:hypothetical protein
MQNEPRARGWISVADLAAGSVADPVAKPAAKRAEKFSPFRNLFLSG